VIQIQKMLHQQEAAMLNQRNEDNKNIYEKNGEKKIVKINP